MKELMATHRTRGRVPIIAVVSLLILSSVADPLRSQEATGGNQQDGQSSRLASALAKLENAVRWEVEDKNLPAFSMAVVDDDQVVWAEGFGFQDPDRTQPATADTIYRVGSISKLFTDIRIMQLVEEGSIDLDVPVQTYVPDFHPENPYDKELTLRQMMSHRSGLVRESPVGNYFDPTEPTLADTIKSLNKTRIVYEPETKTKYSNAAIAVVGAAIENVTQESHPDQVRRAILSPLKMNASSFVVTPEIADRMATGWMWTYDGRRPFVAPDFLLGTGPAGNLYSSVNDLSRFLVCLFNNGKQGDWQLVGPETYRQLITPQVDSSGKPLGFAVGFHVGELDGYKKIGHGGAVYGFSTQLEALPERQLGVVAASALDGSNGVADRLATFALRLMLAVKDDQPLPNYSTTVAVPADRAQELIGSYKEVGGNRTTEINVLGEDVLMVRGTYRRSLRADSESGDVVADDPFGRGPFVHLGRAGTELIVGETRYSRISDSPPAAAPERWKGLIGEYGWDHNTLYILEDRGRLMALIEWFYYYPLTEVDEDTFLFPDYGLYHGEGLKFHRDEEGVAKSVIAAEVEFLRRDIGTVDGETFRIQPVRPIEQLRGEALASSPPRESGDFRATNLVELVDLDPTIQLDIRYASTNNFTGAIFYQQPRAFMQSPAAEAVAQAHSSLKESGLGLLIHDAYRPWYVTKMFWDATPESMKDFVANPASGSRHNRGCAVDLTLYQLDSGEPIQMVAGYDEFSQRAFPLYPGGTSRQRWYRDLLRRTMEPAGFSVYEYEWWHFDFKDWRQYRIGNETFEEIP